MQNVPAELLVVFRESIQPYMMSWLPLDPAGELAEIAVPILVIRGSTDVQETCDDALKLAASNKAARLVEIEGMNHVLKLVNGSAAEQTPPDFWRYQQHRPLRAYDSLSLRCRQSCLLPLVHWQVQQPVQQPPSPAPRVLSRSLVSTACPAR